MLTAYGNATLLDGSETMTPMEHMTVTVENDRIVAVEKDGRPPAGCRVIDLGGRFLMPGLINLHVHLPAGGRPKKKQMDAAKLAKLLMSTAATRAAVRAMCESYAKMELLSGVTTIRTVGGVGSIDSHIRDRINAGKIAGPRLLVSNMAVSVPGGHMAGSVAYAAASAGEAVDYVRRIAADKPDLIKLMITGGVLDAKVKGEPGVLRMPPDYVKLCCEEAHKLGFAVAAHVESPEGLKVALENGVDTIEHGSFLNDELIGLFKRRNARLVCTISPAIPYALFDPAVSRASEMELFNGKVVMDGIVECAKTALANGIPVGLGTDTGCPYVTHYGTWRELVYFKRYVGVSNAFALYTATKRNAEIAGIGGATGSIEPGKSADFLITDGNPLDDLTALRKPYMVVARGRAFESPRVKHYPEVEAELDKRL